MAEHVQAFRALWPGGENMVPPIRPASRPESLEGKRIGFLWDSVFRGDEIFPLLQTGLEQAYSDIEFVSYDAFGSTFGGDEHSVLEALPERLKTLAVDAVISGLGA